MTGSTGHRRPWGVRVASVLLAPLHDQGRRWARRTDLQLMVLAAPVLGFSLGLGRVRQVISQVCFIGPPPWDYRLHVALLLVMGVVTLSAFALGLVRLVLMERLVVRRGIAGPPTVQARVADLAGRLGTRAPHVRIVVLDRPLALAYGLLRPTILLSTWMLAHLDPRELEAVLAHELGHIRRRDYLVVWLATVLRDAFWYVPTSWLVYRRLQRDKELTCDDLAVRVTGRPLALASALAKVWERTAGGPAVGLGQPLVAGQAIEGRITRLLAPTALSARPRGAWAGGLGVGVAGCTALLSLTVINLTVLLSPMTCGPISALAQLFA